MNKMFCFQCEQAANCTGCTQMGVCGKDPETALLQDALVQALKGLGQVAHQAAQLGVLDPQINQAAVKGLFTTLTNVNFDTERVEAVIRHTVAMRAKAEKLYLQAAGNSGASPKPLVGPAAWQPAADRAQLLRQARELGVDARQARHGADVAGVQELIVYGLKGLAAYADHAQILGQHDDDVYRFVFECLDFLAAAPTDLNALLGMALRVGEVNLRVMELLDTGNTGTYGHPQPTAVRITPVAGKAILVSGHDLKDLAELLEQTQGTGINIYTHGEMLPAHSYPQLQKYAHLVGNYGGAWQDQRQEFEQFPGAVLMTTNCIQKPKESYKARIFTTGLVAWPGVTHIPAHDYTPLIEAALAAPGFSEDAPAKTILTGFGHNAVLNVAETVINAVRAGAIRHFFLVGGCDGAKPGRNYFTELAEQIPQDCVILTLACGKYRFNKLEFGDIGGVPRLLDIGQCNDSYSAIRIALALADAFGCSVNDLPLSLVLSWYEQKAVVILLTLLHLGITNIRLGPTLPAFLTPAVLQVLVDKFQIAPVTTAEADLATILGK